MKAIKIVNWDKHYENSQSRRYVKTQWIPIPNKHDGEGYCRLWTENENPAEIFSAWILILQVASKCNTRGLLVKDNGTPHDSMSLSLKTRAPKCIFDSALEFLQTIGWIEMVKGDAKCESRSTLGARSEHAPSPSNNCTPERKEKKRKELKRIELKKHVSSVDNTLDIFEKVWKDYWLVNLKRNNNPKRLASNAWKARVKSGISESDLENATAGYRQCVLHEKTEPQFILQAGTFYGPNERYLEFVDWKPVAGQGAYQNSDNGSLLKQLESQYHKAQDDKDDGLMDILEAKMDEEVRRLKSE